MWCALWDFDLSVSSDTESPPGTLSPKVEASHTAMPNHQCQVKKNCKWERLNEMALESHIRITFRQIKKRYDRS